LSAEDKLARVIDLMQASLAQTGSPDFKTFWDSRKECLELLKENISPIIKAQLWSKYRDLTKEAKRLKEILEEQSAFAAEQIEIAICALERDIEDAQVKLEQFPLPHLPKGLRALKNNLSLYNDKQRELNFLNAQAAHINALRKELIKTEMRIRQKNKFFERLSAAGDRVFPRRKELIKEISDLFTNDVLAFIKAYISEINTERSLQPFREEIKALQAVAKTMTLNTQAFTQTRLKLSECWDKIRAVEKERKKEYVEQTVAYKENADAVRAKIQEFSAAIAEKSLFPNEVQNLLEEVTQFMRSKELSREDVQKLKEELNLVYLPLKKKLIEEEKKRREIELEKEEFRQREIKGIEERCLNLESKLQVLQNQELSDMVHAICQDIEALGLSESEKDSLLRMLVPAKDSLEEQEDFRVLARAQENEENLADLQDVLKKGLSKKTAVKEQMEKYRRACGGSGLDFEQSMYYNDLFNREKARLEKLNFNLATFESALANIKSKKR